MKKTVLTAFVLGALALTSCDKLSNSAAGGRSFNNEVSTQDAMVSVVTSNYERTEAETLVQDSEHEAYSSGVIEYIENGEVTNRIEFKEGGECIRKSDGQDMKYDLKGKKKGESYEKIVVEPIVKSEDCDCIIAGTVEYYEKEEWIATVNYGDGTCDNVATKTWADGSKEFELDCGKDKKWNKKDFEKEDYKKVVIEEFIKSDDCDCIVSGVIEYHYEKDFVVTVDYGDGSCDNLATKSYTKDGVDYNEDFELKCE
jgi:hypothetical protein